MHNDNEMQSTNTRMECDFQGIKSPITYAQNRLQRRIGDENLVSAGWIIKTVPYYYCVCRQISKVFKYSEVRVVYVVW